MVKPQFELSKDQVGKGGIVRDPALREKAADGIVECAKSLGLEIKGRAESSLPGADGNIEIFVLLRKNQ